MTEVQIKKAVKAGNSSAVILPRAWLNKEVKIELVKKSNNTILIETINILNEHLESKKIIGIYLVGSYSRREESEESDIDVLVVTDGIDMEIIKEGIYNIMVVSLGLLRWKLEHDLFPVGQMIREAEPLLNANLLNSLRIRATKNNVKWYLDTTEDKLKIIGRAIEIARKRNNLDYRVTYTLILRIRTLHIIKKLIRKEDYSKKEFVRLINSITRGSRAYEAYLAYKNKSSGRRKFSVEEAESLYEYLKEELDKVKKLVAKISIK